MPAHLTPTARVRRSPFFDATVAAGVTSFSVYNHMYMPTGYGDRMGEYWRLINGVSMWDVACQRQVELIGPDAGRLTQVLCPRKLENMRPGKGWYVAVCDHHGVLLNDPVLLKLSDEHYWLSIADGDLLLWAKAVAAECSLEMTIREPDVSPLAVQGPKAIEVMVDLFGDKIRTMRYFHFRETELDGIPLVLARSGWSKQGGFELYLSDGSRGTALWNTIREAGAPYDIGPGSPNHMERVENALLSFGGDTDAETNPFEVRMGKYVDLDAPDFVIGIRALWDVDREGPERHQLGVILDHDGRLTHHDLPSQVSRANAPAGKMTTNTWSPRLERNIGICLVSVGLAAGDRVSVALPDGRHVAGTMCELPFI